MKNRLVKTSKHNIFELNLDKSKRLSNFLKAYSDAVLFYVDYLWNNRIEFTDSKDQIKVFDRQKDFLDCPAFISTKNINFDLLLSARALKCASTQACGIIKASLDERRKLLFKFSKQKESNRKTRKTRKQLQHLKVIKPDCSRILPELNSICCKFEKSETIIVDGVFTLFSLGKSFGKIIIPINFNKHSVKLKSEGFSLLNSFQISKDNIYFRWEKEISEIKSEGRTVGSDQGINTVITLSDGQTTKIDCHGHSLNSILKKISKKKKGSKAFHSALDHRNNYINWSINQLNFDNINQINLEKISDFRKGNNVGKFLNYFGEVLIREKVINRAQQCGVRIVEQSSAYRSQRCSHCSYVCKGNRSGSLFCCKHCSFQADADLNASLNHEKVLPDSKFLLRLDSKPKEFFWKEKGFFAIDGSELAVPDTKRNKR